MIRLPNRLGPRVCVHRQRRWIKPITIRRCEWSVRKGFSCSLSAVSCLRADYPCVRWVFVTWLIRGVFVSASMWRMEEAPAGRAARGRPSRAARRPPLSCSRPCRSAASLSSTAQTPTSKCRQSRCRGTAQSPAKGKSRTRVTSYSIYFLCASWIDRRNMRKENELLALFYYFCCGSIWWHVRNGIIIIDYAMVRSSFIHCSWLIYQPTY